MKLTMALLKFKVNEEKAAEAAAAAAKREEKKQEMLKRLQNRLTEETTLAIARVVVAGNAALLHVPGNALEQAALEEAAYEVFEKGEFYVHCMNINNGNIELVIGSSNPGQAQKVYAVNWPL